MCLKRLDSILLLLIVCSTALSYGPDVLYKTPPYRPHNSKVSTNNRVKDLVQVYEAKNLEFGFPSETDRKEALRNGNYDPDHPIPIDVDVYYPTDGGKPKIFLTAPRFGSGVPYSLAYLTDVVRPNGSELQPYPSYDWHSTHGVDCDGLTSVYRIQIDSCGHMWILDSGEISFVQHCAPQVVVIDLSTDQLIHRYRLPQNMYKTNISRFVTPLVDIADPAPGGSCNEAFVYMADATGHGIVIYDMVNSRSWRIENKYTYPDPDFGTHTVAGESFELLDGTLGLAQTPSGLGLRRLLFFHSLSNDMEVAIPLDVLNNSTNWGSGISSSLDQFMPLGKRGVQCAASAMSADGFLLCGFLDPIAIFAWDIRTLYSSANRHILVENPATLQFMSGLKIITDPNGKEEVWILSNRLQKAFSGTSNYNEINYRIQRIGLDELYQKRPSK